MKDKDYLTPTEVARILMVSPVTIRAWAQKGMLKAETTPGGHRRFRFHEVEAFARQHNLNIDQHASDHLRILVIDDDKAFAGFLHEVLATLGEAVEIEMAYDGFEAGRRIESFKPDLVLLDLVMPGLDGFEVCKNLKAADVTRGIRVIAMTGFDNEEYVARIRACGAETCLTKPFSPAQLLEAVGTKGLTGQGDVA